VSIGLGIAVCVGHAAAAHRGSFLLGVTRHAGVSLGCDWSGGFGGLLVTGGKDAGGSDNGGSGDGEDEFGFHCVCVFMFWFAVRSAFEVPRIFSHTAPREIPRKK
jgi:hypothetical protein